MRSRPQHPSIGKYLRRSPLLGIYPGNVSFAYYPIEVWLSPNCSSHRVHLTTTRVMDLRVSTLVIARRLFAIASLPSVVHAVDRMLLRSLVTVRVAFCGVTSGRASCSTRMLSESGPLSRITTYALHRCLHLPASGRYSGSSGPEETPLTRRQNSDTRLFPAPGHPENSISVCDAS